jgi:hypothetical protein
MTNFGNLLADSLKPWAGAGPYGPRELELAKFCYPTDAIEDAIIMLREHSTCGLFIGGGFWACGLRPESLIKPYKIKNGTRSDAIWRIIAIAQEQKAWISKESAFSTNLNSLCSRGNIWVYGLDSAKEEWGGVTHLSCIQSFDGISRFTSVDGGQNDPTGVNKGLGWVLNTTREIRISGNEFWVKDWANERKLYGVVDSSKLTPNVFIDSNIHQSRNNSTNIAAPLFFLGGIAALIMLSRNKGK